MRTIPGTTIILPESEPIQLAGEAEAYADEKIDAAYERLYFVACSCGYLVSRDGDTVTVYAHSRRFVLSFDAAGVLAGIRWGWDRDEAEPFTTWSR